jgi:hypothetical protein
MAEGVGPPHLADATDLERWADQRSAQADLPRLVRRLIRHENDQVQRVEMRGGEGVGLPGYDGVVEATRATSFVPDGLSVWEMGTSEDPAGKATDDYKTRTADPLGLDMATTTFVFVTPRRWRKKKDWEQKRRAEGKWRDVRVLDADDIEQALEECVQDRIWLSELLDMPALGVATIEEWWRRFSNGFDPTLTAGVVLAGREDHAAALLRRLSVDVGRTFIKAASVDEGLAFAACSMMAQGAEASELMLSRSLLVHDGITLRRLDSTSSLLILLPYEEHLQREAQLVENHHVVFVVTDGDADIELPPLDHLALEAALREAGLPEADLSRYVRAGNKSLLALQRVATRFGQPDPDQWSQDLSERVVRRAWLAGAWNQLRSGDVEVLEGITGTAQDDIDERLHSAVRQPDPLFTRVGAAWAVAAAEDSWRTARHTIRDADLEALERAVQNVLGAVDPRLELPPDERWSAAIYGKVRVHSSDLRKGLGRTIALLGVRGDEVRLSGGRSARQWAERVVWSLLRRANEDPSAQLWASLEDVLPLLAEAAPDMFLRAVAEAANGQQPLVRELFKDEDDAWHASSPHTGLLWALECVAWSGRHLGFAAELLANLAEIDPGGKLSNRPAASLRDVFRPWLPQTSAPAETRVMTLDALLQRHSEVMWDLLIALLPEHSAVGMHTYKPLFREWAGEGERTVTYGEFFSMVDAVAERIVHVATKEQARWIDVIPEFDRLPEVWRRESIAALEALDRDDLDSEALVALWNAIEDFVRKHRQYPDADWSLSGEWLTPLAAVGERLRPPLATELHRWLFDSWHPDIGVSVRDDFATFEAELQRAREDAIVQILSEQGFGASAELATTVQLPWAVGSALASVNDEHDYEALSLLDSEDGQLVQFAEGFARARGGGAVTAVRPWVERFVGRPLVQARLLQTVADVTDAWELIPELGTDVDEAYWAEFVPHGRGADFPHASEVARQLLRHGRAAMAIDALSLYAERLGDGVDVDVVRGALTQLGTVEDPEIGRVSEHDLTRLLDYLRSRGVDETEVARLEWKFLPALRYESRAPSLQRLLARDPTTFVQLIELAFKPASSEARAEPRDVDPNLASNAYRLLREWRVVPGTREDGSVDAAALQGWLDEVRALLTQSDRLEIGELHVGEVLAHAPTDPDGTFPTRAVREVLETAPNDRLERGFTIGLFNKRGVTRRGMTEGGKQEYDLAKRYEGWAEAVQATHPRTAAALRSVAESYREEGRRNDEEAKRFLEGLDH